MKDGYTYKYDISLPLEVFYECVTIMRERLGDKVLISTGKSLTAVYTKPFVGIPVTRYFGCLGVQC